MRSPRPTPISSFARSPSSASPRVAAGKIDEGLAHLDEAMAAATSGEPASLDTFADVCCTLMLACERAGDAERPQQWSRVLEEFVRRYDHVTLLAFCRFRIADGKFAGYWCLTNVAGLMRQITEEQAVESTPATV